MKKILCVCLSATYQRSIMFNKVELTKVNRAQSYGLYASGKAVNSARVLAQLEKGCVQTICPLGQENADEFIRLSQADNLELSYTFVPGKIRECWTLLDATAATTTELVVGEPPASVENLSPEIKLLKLITEKLDEVDALLLAGSKQGVWPEDIYAVITGIALDKGKVVLADYIGKDLNLTLKSSVPSIIKINDEEFTQTFNMPATRENISSKSKEFGNIIVVTRGVDSTLAAKNGEFYECPTLKVQAVNTTACGDSFNAGFLYEYLNTQNMQAALEKGTWCAAQNAKSQIPGSIL